MFYSVLFYLHTLTLVILNRLIVFFFFFFIGIQAKPKRQNSLLCIYND